jgi:hypothetical protein
MQNVHSQRSRVTPVCADMVRRVAITLASDADAAARWQSIGVSPPPD